MENSVVGITDILIDAINKKYDNIRDLNSLNVNLKEENYEAMIPVIDSIIEDENNSIGKLQQLIDLLSGSEEDIEEGKQDTIEIIDGNEFVESFNKMKKKLILSENFDNVIDDIQAVADPVFVGANEEHDENKKKYEDAMEENKKAAEDTIPDEGDTGKEVKSKALKAMHLSEELFEDLSFDAYDDFNHEIYNAIADVCYKFSDRGLSEKDVEAALEWFKTHFEDDDFEFETKEEEEIVEESLDSNAQHQLNSDVYNAFGDLAFKYYQKEMPLDKDDFKKAFDSFMFRFFKESDEAQAKGYLWSEEEQGWIDPSLEESCGKKKLEEATHFPNIVSDMYKEDPYNLLELLIDWLPNATLDKFGREIQEYNNFQLDIDESCDKDLTEATDLSKIEGTITKALQDNANIINKCKTSDELFKAVSEILAKAHIDTNYSRKFLDKLSKMKNFVGALQYVYNIILSGSGNKTIQLGESFVAEWWGQVDGDTPQEVAKRYNLNVKPLKQKQDEILYKFEGSLEDFSRAMDDGYFYALTVQQDAGHSDDINSLLYESIQTKIAKEQIKRFTEGKMPKNWSVEKYLEKLTEKKHISNKEAKSLKEWYSKNK